MALDRAAIQSLKSSTPAGPKFVDVDVPEWGGTVKVRTITSGEKGRFDASIGTQKDDPEKWAQLRERQIILAACDDEGKPIFNEADLTWLCEQPFALTSRIFIAYARLNGMLDTQEDAEKNSRTPG